MNFLIPDDMPDKKPTDNEIINALLECSNNGYNENNGSCKNCPYNEVAESPEECMTMLAKAALDLINRQKAEIDGLQQLVNLSIDTQNDLTDKLLQAEENIKTAKVEAYKEFAEKLKKGTYRIALESASSKYRYIREEHIDVLLKEMVGAEDERTN